MKASKRLLGNLDYRIFSKKGDVMKMFWGLLIFIITLIIIIVALSKINRFSGR